MLLRIAYFNNTHVTGGCASEVRKPPIYDAVETFLESCEIVRIAERGKLAKQTRKISAVYHMQLRNAYLTSRRIVEACRHIWCTIKKYLTV